MWQRVAKSCKRKCRGKGLKWTMRQKARCLSLTSILCTPLPALFVFLNIWSFANVWEMCTIHVITRSLQSRRKPQTTDNPENPRPGGGHGGKESHHGAEGRHMVVKGVLYVGIKEGWHQEREMRYVKGPAEMKSSIAHRPVTIKKVARKWWKIYELRGEGAGKVHSGLRRHWYDSLYD